MHTSAQQRDRLFVSAADSLRGMSSWQFCLRVRAHLAALQVLVVQARQLRLPEGVQRRIAGRRHQVEALHQPMSAQMSTLDMNMAAKRWSQIMTCPPLTSLDKILQECRKCIHRLS